MSDRSPTFEDPAYPPQPRGDGLVTLILADELTLFRDGLAAICEAERGFRIIGQCGDGASALRLIESLQPHIAILDVGLPDLFTIEVVKRVRDSALPTRCLVMSASKDRKTVIEALRGGAQGFLLKTGSGRHLVEAIRLMMSGGIYISPQLQIEKVFGKARGPEDPYDSLSAREYQVFSLLVEGLRAKEIAARLNLSPKTVDTYRANMMRKLDIHDVAGLVKFAIQRKLAAAAE
jgi:DNA-binding NarL/FixJ family response regulator